MKLMGHVSNDDEEIGTVFAVVPVDSLPPPRHLRCPCAFEREHVQIVEAIGDVRVAFDQFVAEMRPRLRECDYHKPNWVLAAEAAIAAMGAAETVAREAAGELAAEADRIARHRGADDRTLDEVEALFLFPIQVIAEGRVLNNGQRRTCALTAAGVRRCPVLVDTPPT